MRIADACYRDSVIPPRLPHMSSLRSRRAAKAADVPTLRPMIDQLVIITAACGAASEQPLQDVATRQGLRSRALATVMVIDNMSAEATPR